MTNDKDKSLGPWDEQTSIEILAERQGVGPFRKEEWLKNPAIWPPEDSIEEFEAWLRRSRNDGEQARAASGKTTF